MLGAGTLFRPGIHQPLTELQLSCPDHLVLPVELIPALEPFPSTPTAAAASFVGFGAAVHRVPRVPQPDSRQDGLARARVNGYWHRGLSGTRAEESWFKREFGPENLVSRPRHGDSSDALAQAIVGKGVTGPIAEMEHFSCHFRRTTGLSSDTIVLRPRRYWTDDIEVTAEDLSVAGVNARPCGGLVFLNACGTQSVDAAAVSSVSRVLLQSGRDAVITTWCDVPDDVAYVMSKLVYGALRAGASVAEALWIARCRLLLDENNPLGLLYTAVGNGRYRLAN